MRCCSDRTARPSLLTACGTIVLLLSMSMMTVLLESYPINHCLHNTCHLLSRGGGGGVDLSASCRAYRLSRSSRGQLLNIIPAVKSSAPHMTSSSILDHSNSSSSSSSSSINDRIFIGNNIYRGIRSLIVTKHRQLNSELDVVRSKWDDKWSDTRLRFKENPWQYLSIPIVAATVGYITNYLGVMMLFYPIQWRGIPLYRWSNQPFGLLGWQGVVPSKRFKMASTMVDVTISRLLKVSEVFGRLESKKMAAILSSTIKDVVYRGLLPLPILKFFLDRVASDIIVNIESIFNIKDFVVRGMTTNPRVLGDFFQRVGSHELSFLVSSGTYFGFMLGIVQMLQWVIYPANWTLPVGGAIVGYVTNWIALKWIFEPLVPTQCGPFLLQGLFLKRQNAVSEEFSSYISSNILTSRRVWQSILSEPNLNEFNNIIRRNIPFLSGVQLAAITSHLRSSLSNSQHALHQYINQRLDLQRLLIERMKQLTPAEFEQVLHPIFQEDEVILIAAGGVLGFLAGGLQWWINDFFEKRQRRTMQLTNSEDAVDGDVNMSNAEVTASSAAVVEVIMSENEIPPIDPTSDKSSLIS